MFLGTNKDVINFLQIVNKFKNLNNILKYIKTIKQHQQNVSTKYQILNPDGDFLLSDKQVNVINPLTKKLYL